MADNDVTDEWAEFSVAGPAPADSKASDDEAWSEFSVEAPGNTEQAGDLPMVGQQFAAGVAEGGGAMAVMLKGAAMGAKVPIPHPAAKAGFTVLGGALGLFGGSAMVDKTLEFFGVDRPEDLPPEQRPAAFGARSFGGAVPFAVTPFAAARQGVVLADKGIGKLANQIIQTAKQSPKTFAALEASSAGTAALAAGTAEKIAPGETGVRIGAEIAGGLLAPGNLSTGAFRTSSKFVRKMWNKMSPRARETQAGKTLQEIFDMTGEDPAQVVELLKIDGILDDTGAPILTAAQETGSDALSALQKALTDKVPDFKASVSQKEKDALDAMRGMAVALTRTGDPGALQAASEMQAQYVRTLLQTMIDDQTTKAALEVSKITQDTPEALGDISIKAREALDGTIKEVRKAESAMWEAVPADVDAGVDNLEEAVRALKAELLPEEVDSALPKIVRDFLDRKTKEARGAVESSIIEIPDFIGRPTPDAAKTATSGEMKRLRSNLLDMSRKATNAGEFNQARIYSDLANAVLDDIDTAFTDVGDAAYETARNFSREMNEVFSRSFVGKATAQGKYGDRMAPELMLRKAMASGGEAWDLNVQQIENATNFLEGREMGTEISRQAAATVLEAQERFTRLMFSRAVDPTTGLVNPKQMNALMSKNEAMLNRFPEVREQLTKAVSAEVDRKVMEQFTDGGMARQALVSTDVEGSVKEMIDIAKSSKARGITEQQAMQSVSGSMFDAALRRATDTKGNLNLDKFKALIGEPPAEGGRSVLDILKSKGVIDAQHHEDINRVFGMLERLEKAKTSGHAVKLDDDATDAVMTLLSRVAGTTIAGKAGAKSIQAHQAGANFANHIAKKLTSVKMDEIFIRALNDKDFMITLLEKVDTPKQAEMQARQINAWLLQAMTDLTEIEDEQ